MTPNHLDAARAYALFASDLSSHCCPNEVAVAAAIRTAIAAYGGIRGCAGEVGAAYGEHPETAAPRMRWARHVIMAIYSPAADPCSEQAGDGRHSQSPPAQIRDLADVTARMPCQAAPVKTLALKADHGGRGKVPGSSRLSTRPSLDVTSARRAPSPPRALQKGGPSDA